MEALHYLLLEGYDGVLEGRDRSGEDLIGLARTSQSKPLLEFLQQAGEHLVSSYPGKRRNAYQNSAHDDEAY